MPMHSIPGSPAFNRPLRLGAAVATFLLLAAVLWQVWFPLGLWQLLGWSTWCLPLGLLSALPPLLMIPLLESSIEWRWLRVFRNHVRVLLLPLFGHLGWSEILALAYLAGLSEEVFFRGMLQQSIGLIPTSLAFGILHAVSIPYMVWATLTGLYLGWLLQATQNLWVPIFAHTVIDLVGLVYIRLIVASRYGTAGSVMTTEE